MLYICVPKVITLFHGSPNIVGRPTVASGSRDRDFGPGFYCTRYQEVAEEWATPSGAPGYVNRYTLDTHGLRTLDLRRTATPTMDWLTVMAFNRTFRAETEFGARAQSYLASECPFDLRSYDIIIGPRGDDSYFSFATDFINNTVPFRRLSSVMDVGKEGMQTVLVSGKAISRLRYEGSDPVDPEESFRRRCERDLRVRTRYLDREGRGGIDEYDIMMDDLMMGRVGRDDPRLR